MREELLPPVGREIQKSFPGVTTGDAGNCEPRFGNCRVEPGRLHRSGDWVEL